MAQLGYLPPGARGWLAGEQLEQNRQMQGMGQLGSLIQMQGALQQQQQQQQLYPLQRMMLERQVNAPEPLLNLGPGHTAINPRTGQPVFSVPAKPEPPRTRSRFEGSLTIQEEQLPDGTWKEIGRGPRFAASREDANPYTNIQADPLKPGKYIGFNTKTQKMEPVPDNFGPGAQIPTDAKGEDFLKFLDQSTATTVKGVAEGRIPLPSSFALRSPYWQNVLGLVERYDPSFHSGRSAVWKDFTSGMAARNVTAINTVIAHMGTMNEAVDALGNNNLVRANQAVNRLRTEMGQPQVINFDIAKQAVATEMMRVFRQVQASVQETQEWESHFKSAGSPQQLKEAIKMGVQLLKGRIDAMDDQWKRGMNTDKGFPNLVSPRSQTVLKQIGLSVSDNDKPVEFGGYTFPNQKALDDYKKAAGL